MHGLGFEWDPQKARANQTKHRVGFAEASSVFGDMLSIAVSDSSPGGQEDRSVILGMSTARRLLVVVHTI